MKFVKDLIEDYQSTNKIKVLNKIKDQLKVDKGIDATIDKDLGRVTFTMDGENYSIYPERKEIENKNNTSRLYPSRYLGDGYIKDGYVYRFEDDLEPIGFAFLATPAERKMYSYSDDTDIISSRHKGKFKDFLKEKKEISREGDGIVTELPLLSTSSTTYYNLDYFPNDSARLETMHKFLANLNNYLKEYDFKFDWKDVVWMDDMMGACIHLPKRNIIIWEGENSDYEVNTKHRDNIEVNSPLELMKIIKPRNY